MTICPPAVFGPVLSEASDLSALPSSMALLYAALSRTKPVQELAVLHGECVDVRSVAGGHIRALEVPEAGGERFILSTGPWIWQDWCTLL